ncbi:MAG: helix-turn-helix domain-containing protein [Pseudomonadota bacterium]
MDDELFKLLKQSAEQTLEIAKGTADTTTYVVHVPAAIDTKAIRAKLKMSQSVFAQTFGFSKRTLEDWEQGRRMPDRSARLFLKLIDKEPDVVLGVLRAA